MPLPGIITAPSSTPSYIPPSTAGAHSDSDSTSLTHHRHHRTNPQPNPQPNPYPWVSPDYYDYTWSWNSPYYYPTVTEYYAPVISSFTANPTYIQAGQSSTLVWNVSDADLVSISPSVGSVAASGSIAVFPTYTTSYTLTATNSQGAVSYSTTVTVAPPYASSYMGTYGTGSTVLPGTSGNTPLDTAGTAYRTTGSGAGDTVNISGTGNGNPTALMMYGLLIGLLAIAAAVIIVLLVRKPAVARAGSNSAAKAGYVASAAAPVSALPATGMPVTTPVEAGLPAKFVSAGGSTMPVTGKPLGRRDFQTLTSPDKAELISRKHILVTYENSQYQIEDLNSTNGTKLNGSEIRGTGKHTITSGDTVELAGALNLIFKV